MRAHVRTKSRCVHWCRCVLGSAGVWLSLKRGGEAFGDESLNGGSMVTERMVARFSNNHMRLG
jgi:hypothetical protein